ncbi:hypothetical protein D3C78_1788010 [compost metagenome]
MPTGLGLKDPDVPEVQAEVFLGAVFYREVTPQLHLQLVLGGEELVRGEAQVGGFGAVVLRRSINLVFPAPGVTEANCQ